MGGRGAISCNPCRFAARLSKIFGQILAEGIRAALKEYTFVG